MRILSVIFVLLLSACGGGGSSPTPAPTSIFKTAASIPVNKYRIAQIDYRYDQPYNQTSGTNKDGYPVNSYEALVPMINKIKAVGFNTIQLQSQTSINLNNGMVSLDDQSGFHKSLPADIWRVVDYIKSQNMNVFLALNIVDSVNDNNLTLDKLNNNVSYDYLFSQITVYQKNIAVQAQQHNVDLIFISQGNTGFESDQFEQYWVSLINNIRSVYNGKISYSTFDFYDTKIFDHTDYAGVYLIPPLSQNTSYIVNDIVNMYFNDMYGINDFDKITQIYQHHHKTILPMFGAQAVDFGTGILFDIYSIVFANVNLSSNTLLTSVRIDNTAKHTRIQAFMELYNKYLINISDGFIIDDFTPWLQDKNYFNTDNAFYLLVYYGFNLYNDDESLVILNNYFSNPWGYHTY